MKKQNDVASGEQTTELDRDGNRKVQPLVRPCGRCAGSKEEPNGSTCGRCGGTGREMTQAERDEWMDKIRKIEEARIKAWEEGLARI